MSVRRSRKCGDMFMNGLLAAVLMVLGTWRFSPTTAAPSLPQGGGTTNGAWVAQFWDNTDMAGEPVWTQRDIRVRYDWEDWRPIVGSRGEQVRNFPTDNFSIRWTSTFLTRFSEYYTFVLISDEGARLKVREQGSEQWTTLIDAWDAHEERADSGSIMLDSGRVYEAELEYYDLSGHARCELYWQSQSTPYEVIDHIASSICHYSGNNQSANDYENAVVFGDNEFDENGWPKNDINTVLGGNRAKYPGRYLLQFTGKADIEIPGAVFHSGGETYEVNVPSGVGYDQSTNTTRIEFDGEDKVRLRLNNTLRTPQSDTGSGVTNIYVMRPTRKNGTEYHLPGEAANGEWREAMKPYVAFRVQRTGLNDNPSWDKRTPPTYANISNKHERSEICYEKLIMQANECGRDLHFNFGGSHNEEWMRKFAKLTYYGSDGSEPYDGPTENPVYPPLNSNLRIYLEHGNEMGWSAIQPRGWTRDDLPRHFEQKDSVWQAINYDQRYEEIEHGAVMRYHAYRTTKMSLHMRKVWGDEAMGEKVRVMIYGQYQNPFQNHFCQYIDNYFNNGAGNFVENPYPVNQHLWGAGMAVYYGCKNIWGEGETYILSDGSFEENDISAGQAQIAPSSAWEFEGTAGVVDYRFARSPAHTTEDPGSLLEVTEKKAYGFAFTVGDKDVFMYAFGRYDTDDKEHTVLLYEGDGQSYSHAKSIADIHLNMDKEFKESAAKRELREGYVYSPTTYCGWITGSSIRPGIYRLPAGKQYFIVSVEEPGDRIPGRTQFSAHPSITIDGAVEGSAGNYNGTRPLDNFEIIGETGTGYGHVNFLFTDSPLSPAPGTEIIPVDPSFGPNFPETQLKHKNPEIVKTGSKMAFLVGQSAISQQFTVSDEGEYAVVLCGAITDPLIPQGVERGAHRWERKACNPLNVYLDDSLVAGNLVLGESRKPLGGYWTFASKYLTLSAGTHTVRIEGTNDLISAVTYLDGVHLASMDDYFGGPNATNFLEGGSATGTTASRFEQKCRSASGMAQNWGLVASTYEGGNSVGGDWDAGGVLFWEQAKWWHPYTKTAEQNAFAFWYKLGGTLACHYYPPFPWSNFADCENYVQWQAAMERTNTWTLEASFDQVNYGFMAPSTMTCDSMHYTGGRRYSSPYNDQFKTDPELDPNDWKCWRIIAPKAAMYEVTADVAGGEVRLSVDETNEVARGTGEVAGSVFLTKGAHSIKVKALSETATVNSVSIGEPVVGVKNRRGGNVKEIENGIFRKSVEIGIKSAGGN